MQRVRIWGLALAIALLCSVSGCAGVLLQGVDNKASLTPEQIDAYNRVGSAVYGCFQLGGPPPAGNTTWIVMPKTATTNLTFMSNCMITGGSGATVLNPGIPFGGPIAPPIPVNP